MQRTLLVVLAVFGAVAIASGLTGIVAGPEGLPGGGPVPATVDSQYRFANTFWLGAGLGLWWSLRRWEERAWATRLTLLTATAGGLARLVSIIATGLPHPVFLAVLVLELAILPPVIWWHGRVTGLPFGTKARRPS